MEIKVCGPGCAKCDQVYKQVTEALQKSGKVERKESQGQGKG